MNFWGEILEEFRKESPQKFKKKSLEALLEELIEVFQENFCRDLTKFWIDFWSKIAEGSEEIQRDSWKNSTV